MTRAVLGPVAAAVLVLAACSSPARPASFAPATNQSVHSGVDDRGFNAGDVMFLQMMVPHHRQGLTIVGLARDRAANPAVRTLAAAIEATQADELATMSDWLRQWRQPPEAVPGAHTDHGGMPDTTAREIAALRETSGPDFDRRFLNVLIAHQDDAVQLAAMETATGRSADATALAQRIRESRSAQIDQMLRLLGQG